MARANKEGSILSTPARTKQDDLRKIIIHASQFLSPY